MIVVDKIIAIEAQESYCKIHLKDQQAITVSHNLKHYESVFNEDIRFFRTHKSWLINISYLINYSKSRLEINLNSQLKAKLSKYKKQEFEHKLVSIK